MRAQGGCMQISIMSEEALYFGSDVSHRLYRVHSERSPKTMVIISMNVETLIMNRHYH